MEKNRVQQIAVDIVTPIVEKNDFELVDVEFKKEGPEWYLRVLIDKPNGITIDDCKIVSDEFSKILDDKDPIPHNYILEVSSPGIERTLKKDSDFERFKGSNVYIKLYKAIDGKKEFEGELLGLEDDMIEIQCVDCEDITKFKRDDVALVKLMFKF